MLIIHYDESYINKNIIPQPSTYVNWCYYSISPYNLLRGYQFSYDNKNLSLDEILDKDPKDLISYENKLIINDSTRIEPKSHPLEFSIWSIKNMINALIISEHIYDVLSKYYHILNSHLGIPNLNECLTRGDLVDRDKLVQIIGDNLANISEEQLNIRVGVQITPELLEKIKPYCLFIRKCMNGSNILESYRTSNVSTSKNKYMKYKNKYLQLKKMKLKTND